MLRRAIGMMRLRMIAYGESALASQVRRVQEYLQACPPPPAGVPVDIINRWATADAWAAVAYQTTFEDPAQGIKTRPTCQGKGCWGCCRGQISTAPGEVQAIAPHLTKAQVEAVMAYDPPVEREAMCPLLGEDKLCGIYAFRPQVCRSYMVITPRDDCYPEITGPGQRVASPVDDILMELLEEVVLNPDKRGFIYKLKDELRRTGRA